MTLIVKSLSQTVVALPVHVRSWRRTGVRDRDHQWSGSPRYLPTRLTDSDQDFLLITVVYRPCKGERMLSGVWSPVSPSRRFWLFTVAVGSAASTSRARFRSKRPRRMSRARLGDVGARAAARSFRGSGLTRADPVRSVIVALCPSTAGYDRSNHARPRLNRWYASGFTALRLGATQSPEGGAQHWSERNLYLPCTIHPWRYGDVQP